MLSKEILDKLEIIWDAIKDKCLCMKLTGSAVISYITNKSDIDVVFIYSDEMNGHEVRLPFFENEEIKTLRKELKEKYNLAIFGTTLSYERGTKPYVYLYKGDVCLFGDASILTSQSVLENKDKFRQACKEWLEKFNQTNKALYHVLTIKYFLENNKEELTQEQIDSVNLVHDFENKDRILQLYNECVEYFK